MISDQTLLAGLFLMDCLNLCKGLAWIEERVRWERLKIFDEQKEGVKM